MDPNRLTLKSQEALHDAQTKALRFGHTELDTDHLLLALLELDDGAGPLHRCGVDKARVEVDLAAVLESFTAGQNPSPSP